MPDHAGSYNGLAFGPGTDYRVKTLRWYRRSIQILTPDLPRYHGGLIGASYESAREVEIGFIITGTTEAGLVTRIDSLFQAFSPRVDDELPFVWTPPGQTPRRINLRPIEDGAGGLGPADWASVSKEISFRLSASDPAIYDDTLDSETLSVFAAAAGLSYPVLYPKIYGAAGAGSGTTVTNSGDWITWPELRIAGPTSGTLSSPIVENVTSGLALEFTANGGVEVAAGQTLVILTHPKDRSVLFTTGASRYGRLSTASTWFGLEPGANEMRFRASGSTAGASLTVLWRSAWI